MIYSKNYDKKEIIRNFDASKEAKLPSNWEECDAIKVLRDSEYPLDETYKIIHK